MKFLLSPSWKTTAGAIVAFLALLLGQVSKSLDSDPETKTDWTVIVEAAGILWLGLNARDSNVSDESSSTKGSTPKDD